MKIPKVCYQLPFVPDVLNAKVCFISHHWIFLMSINAEVYSKSATIMVVNLAHFTPETYKCCHKSPKLRSILGVNMLIRYKFGPQ